MRALSALLLFATMISAALVPESEFSCRKTPNCDCFRSVGGYELLCSSGNENIIVTTIRPSAYIQVQCLPSFKSSDYEYLEGLRVGTVEEVDFRLCPLPNSSLPQLLSSIGVTSATTFRFQSHRDLSTTFDKKYLSGFDNLTHLLLMNNNLTDLPEDLLLGLPKLKRLDLKENNVRLKAKFFEPVPDLEELELGGNQIVQLDPPILSNLSKLLLLNLWKNNLTNLTRSMFSGLKSLELLDISSNSVVSLPHDVFHDLPNLVHVSLISNNITHLPYGLFSKNKYLELFKLNNNHQTLSIDDELFSNLTKLTGIYMKSNGITSLPENLFWGSERINIIILSDNSLEKIPEFLFRDQKNLEDLDLSKNLIEHLPDNVFTRLKNLRSLNLGHNRIKSFSRKVFYNLHNLETLDLQHNKLSFIDNVPFSLMSELKEANFSHNHLSLFPEDSEFEFNITYQDSFGRKSPFRDCVSLEHLYLSNNFITEIFSDWRQTLTNLRTLDLSYNKIMNLSDSDVQFLGSNITVDLRHNNISVIKLQKLERLALAEIVDGNTYPKRNVRLLLDENPLYCDCRAYELFRYFEHRLNPAVYLMVTFEAGNLKCSFPNLFSGMKVKDVFSQELTCNLSPHYDCPERCNCSVRRHDWALVIDCNGSGLKRAPDNLPFVMETNHTELNLKGNQITVFPNLTQPDYKNVTVLQLSSNNISSIEEGTLNEKLEVLTIDNNNLTALSSSIIKFLRESKSIRILTLHNNPWKCDCSARNLLDLIQEKFKEIPYLSNVTCAAKRQPLSKMSMSDLCPFPTVVMVLCVAAAIFGLLVGTIAALYYRYQREVKIWLYSHRFCLWFVTEEELDRDKLYDAFISYSHKDEVFVVNTLVPELESGDYPLKLCLHYRDWIVGEWIPNQIVNSVGSSRRTLIVLSPNFLESEWSRMEFRAAHKQALSEGRSRVIVVLYGDVGPTDDLDPELRAYISMNTYVKWGDPWFWGKLKYALPHPQSLVRTNLNFMKRRTKKKEKNHIDDILELIHKFDPSASPAGGTTPPIEGLSNGNPMLDK